MTETTASPIREPFLVPIQLSATIWARVQPKHNTEKGERPLHDLLAAAYGACQQQPNSTSAHLEAQSVTIAADGSQVADTEDGRVEQRFEAIYSAVEEGLGGRWATVEIYGRDYVLVMTPYCR